MELKKVLAIFKPGGFTSFEVVDYLKRFLPKGVKVGHAGTLDPLAEGVLVVGIGEGTKELAKIKDLEKEYLAVIFLGAETETLDREGKPKFFTFSKKPSLEEIKGALKGFEGEIYQVPPHFSAVKIEGKRAYRLAREGKKVELRPRKVFIRKIELLFYKFPFLGVKVVCGAGVYIRALARDIGEKLQTKAYLYYLRRERVGNLTLKKAISLLDFGSFFKDISSNNYFAF